MRYHISSSLIFRRNALGVDPAPAAAGLGQRLRARGGAPYRHYFVTQLRASSSLPAVLPPALPRHTDLDVLEATIKNLLRGSLPLADFTKPYR